MAQIQMWHLRSNVNATSPYHLVRTKEGETFERDFRGKQLMSKVLKKLWNLIGLDILEIEFYSWGLV